MPYFDKPQNPSGSPGSSANAFGLRASGAGSGSGSGWTPSSTPNTPRPTGPKIGKLIGEGIDRALNPGGTGGTGGTGSSGWQGAQPSQTDTPKQKPAPSKHRTVFKLIPVYYKISLIYLGSQRVRRAPAAQSDGYHGRFKFQRGNTTLNPLTELENAVRHPAPGLPADPEVDAVSLPLSQGGDNRNPSGENQVYRVLVLDNHGLRQDDPLLGSGGNNKSKPESYEERDFIHDIVPDAPFRVVVRKYYGRTPVDITAADMRILWEIKDPPEEIAQTANPKAREFIEEFINKRKLSAGADGDDNSEAAYSGVRPDKPSSGAAPPAGVKADSVLFQLPYIATPPIDREVPPAEGQPAPPLTDVQDHPDPLTPLAAHGTNQALSELTEVEEEYSSGKKVKVGVSDVLFRPPPVGGDNYRFLLSLTDPAGVDVRTVEERGKSVRLVDSKWRKIPHPKSFVANRIVVWRQIDVRLEVFTNKLNTSPINWTTVKDWYREAFVELNGPITRHELKRLAWRDHVRRYFREQGINVPGINQDRFYMLRFSQYFWPKLLWKVPAGWNPSDLATWTSDFTAANGAAPSQAEIDAHRQSEWEDNLDWDFTEGYTRNVIQDVCTQLGITPPQRQTRQADTEGFHMFITRSAFKDGTTSLGMYMYEQQFFMRSRANPTLTFAHELGHGLYMRHGMTSRKRDHSTATLHLSGGTTEAVTLYDLSRNCYPYDHAQNNLVDCIMSYDNDTIPVNFCGMCLLSLRFYDMKRLRQSDHAEITENWDPVDIYHWTGETARSTFPALDKDEEYFVSAIANLEPTLNDSARKSGKLLETAPGAAYEIQPTGAGVTVSIVNGWGLINVDSGATSGNYTLRFKVNGTVRATKNFTVS